MSTVVKTEFKTVYTDQALQLESGQLLRDITIAYETYGTLNADRSNVIWVCHALSGDAHAAFEHADNPDYEGWWTVMIGPGKALDTDRYFIVCSNVLGGCKGTTGPSSIDPATQKPYGLMFPVVTIRDMVRVQKALFDALNLNRIALVIGGSMGGFQALEWAIEYPTVVDKCCPIAAPPKVPVQAVAFGAVGRNAIVSDPHWNDGDYYGKADQPNRGLSVARMIGHIAYLSQETLDIKFGRNLQSKNEYGYDFNHDFQIESYLNYQGEKFVNRFDANSYLYLTKAVSYFDLSKSYGGLEAAFAGCDSHFLIVSFSTDWLYPPKECKEMAKVLMKLNRRVTYSEIDSPYGHDSFLLENEQLSCIVKGFLDHGRA